MRGLTLERLTGVTVTWQVEEQAQRARRLRCSWTLFLSSLHPPAMILERARLTISGGHRCPFPAVELIVAGCILLPWGDPSQVVLDVDDEEERASADRLGRAIRQHVTMAEEITAAAMVRLALGILSCLT